MSFPNPRASKNHTSECWKLGNEVLKVPSSAILNRNNMASLGKGFQVGVLEASIQLQDDSTCYAVLITDFYSSINQTRKDRCAVLVRRTGPTRQTSHIRRVKLPAYLFTIHLTVTGSRFLMAYCQQRRGQVNNSTKNNEFWKGTTTTSLVQRTIPYTSASIMTLIEFDDITRQTDLPKHSRPLLPRCFPLALHFRLSFTGFGAPRRACYECGRGQDDGKDHFIR